LRVLLPVHEDEFGQQHTAVVAPGSAIDKFFAMRIHDQLHLHDIQVGFNRLFPHLKISFYAVSHKEGEGSAAKNELDAHQQLSRIRTVHKEGEIVIQPEMTVAELEGIFASHFGLNAQIFRKSGNLWMQTTATDHWSLGEQNRKGGSSESHYVDKLLSDEQEGPLEMD